MTQFEQKHSVSLGVFIPDFNTMNIMMPVELKNKQASSIALTYDLSPAPRLTTILSIIVDRGEGGGLTLVQKLNRMPLYYNTGLVFDLKDRSLTGAMTGIE